MATRDRTPGTASGQEAARLARLRASDLVGTGFEPVFDAIVRSAGAVTGMPVAAINLIDADRQWNKAVLGRRPLHMERTSSLCAVAVAEKRVLEVPDLLADPCFADSPLARGPAAIRAYFGVPIVLDGTHAVGTLCVADDVPRHLLPEQVAALEHLAAAAAEIITLREQARGGDEKLRRMYDATPAMMQSTDERGRLVAVSDLWLEKLGFDRDAVLGRTVDALLRPERLPDAGDGPEGDRHVAARIRDNRGGVREMTMVSRSCEDRRTGGRHGVGRLTVTVLEDVTDRRRAETGLHAAHDFLRRTGTLAGVGGWEVDLRTDTVTWSDEVCRLHDRPPGYRPTLAEGLSYYAPEARPVIKAAVTVALERGEGWDLELPVVSASGRRFWARVMGSVEHDARGAVRLAGAFQDVTARKRMERELAESRELLQVTLDSIGDGVITAGVDGAVSWMNPAAERLTGWNRGDAAGRALEAVCRIVDDDDAAEGGGKALPPMFWHAGRELVLVGRSGVRCAVKGTWTPIRTPDGAVHGAVAVLHDVSEQRRLARELRHQATHDALTGLPNRSCFEAQLSRLMAQGIEPDRDGPGDVLLLVDLDQFKAVNDRCGHAAGDRLLRQVAVLLRGAVRAGDTVARLGGDEFAVILRDVGVGDARRMAQAICDGLDDSRFVHGEHRFRVGASIGVVALAGGRADPAAVLRLADQSCFRAKEGGRNRVHLWEGGDDDGSRHAREMCWLTRLERALDEDGFVLHAQRIGRLAGPDGLLRCEVLLRLPDGAGGLLMPGQFMPAAERFRLAGRIDRWVVRAVFGLLEAGPVPPALAMLSVNLSGQSIEDPSFRLFMRGMIAGAGFDLRLLCVEITETAAIARLDEARRLVEELRAAGIRVALDDFGAGASWFSYLRSLPVDFLKIDGQFVRDLLGETLNRAAVRCFREVADSLGVRCIAEFVEEEAQRAALLALGVELGQGYLIHQPAPLCELLAHADRASSDPGAVDADPSRKLVAA